MKTHSILTLGTLVLGLVTLVAPVVSSAAVHSQSGNLIVMQPNDLPEQAQTPGEALLLHADTAGDTYLYIEQLQGARLAIFNITDPAHITFSGDARLSGSGPFDFVQPLNDQAELVRFRSNVSLAVLSLRKAKAPVLHVSDALGTAQVSEALGESAMLAIDNSARPALPPTLLDYQVIDISNASVPGLVATVQQVGARVSRDETGTTFLLGSQGLTVIRRPAVEQEYKNEEQQMEHN